jgi:hypothetical protein
VHKVLPEHRELKVQLVIQVTPEVPELKVQLVTPDTLVLLELVLPGRLAILVTPELKVLKVRLVTLDTPDTLVLRVLWGAQGIPAPRGQLGTPDTLGRVLLLVTRVIQVTPEVKVLLEVKAQPGTPDIQVAKELPELKVLLATLVTRVL